MRTAGIPPAGILLFALFLAMPAVASFFVREPARGHDHPKTTAEGILTLVREYRWLWFSSIILIGITGVVTSLYPQFSGASSDQLGIWIAGMSIATICCGPHRLPDGTGTGPGYPLVGNPDGRGSSSPPHFTWRFPGARGGGRYR